MYSGPLEITHVHPSFPVPSQVHPRGGTETEGEGAEVVEALVVVVATVVVVEGFTVVVVGLGHQLGGEMVEGQFHEEEGAARRRRSA
jgi:hypothetical protein